MVGTMTNIHLNMLVPSYPNTVMTGIEVESRFIDVCGMYRRVRDVDLVPPSELDNDMKRWREMRVRHKKGDYRHRESEIFAQESIMKWILDTKLELVKQPKK